MGKISKAVRGIADIYNGASLIVRIIVGLIIGTVLALTMPHVTWIGEFGTLFVAALKAAAPILVFVLVASALAQGTSKLDRRFGTVLFLYLFTTFLAAVVAVLTSRLFPQTLSLGKAAKADVVPQGLSEVIQTLLTNIVANPIQAIIDGNYICILMWACLFGLAMKSIANESSKAFMANVADAVSQVIRWVINLAPFGIMGLVFTNVADNGLSAFTKYGSLLLLLVGTMLLMVLVFGPLVIFIFLRRNPYPLVYRCFKEYGLTAFFTRSSAANIPVNMQLCEKLGLDKDMYSVSIPLGATINMNGAAITITIMAMAAAAGPGRTRIDPDDEAFAHPADMPAAIRDWCRGRGKVPPADDAALVRCIFESLAARYGEVLDNLRGVAPFAIERLHVIGGGAQNDLLNQLTADACGIPVVAGPSEATAIGNVMVQARALGLVGSLARMRDYIRRSVEVREFLPRTK